MGGDENRAPFPILFQNQVPDLLDPKGIQPGDRFIQKQDVRIMEERPHNRQLLQHSPGELGEPFVLHPGQSDPRLATEGGTPFRFNGNVPNTNLISNLPVNACVEVPVWASRKGLEPVAVGALPPQVAALTNLSSQIEEMAIEAILTNNPRLIYQAVANSPLTAAVLSLAEIKEMVNEMLEKNRDYLPQFTHFRA